MIPKLPTLFLALWLPLCAASEARPKPKPKPSVDYTQWADPMVGTGGHGHTFPGATRPFGMVQLSPDTRNDGSWDSCAGYHHSDTSILGFSHTHLSGVGVPDYGDILLMPMTGEAKLVPGDAAKPRSGYRSAFSHATEKAEPGYYRVRLDDYGIRAELTATERVGYHRYTVEQDGPIQVLLDLIHRDPVTEASIRVIDDRRIEGMRRSKFWAGDQYHYFALEFDRPIAQYSLFDQGKDQSKDQGKVKGLQGQALQAIATFHVRRGESLGVKVALSAVSADGAWKNLRAEGQGTFDAARQAAKTAWNRSLGKIHVEGGTPQERRTFYSALYHCLLTPNLFQDVDGQYRGMDGQVHTAKGFTNYTVFSLWDTFRTLHPLLNLIEPERSSDFVKTLVNMSQLSGELPMWELAANDTRCMIGYHGVSVIADAWAKGNRTFDLAQAFEEMKKTALLDKRGLKAYRTLGYVPSNQGSQGVSKTLEYAYDDWCIAQVAQALNKPEEAATFLARSQFYRNVFDPMVGFMRGRVAGGEWVQGFDPQAPGRDYTEGNAWQYSPFAPHDPAGLSSLFGGKAGLAAYLDKLFSTPMTLDLGEENDISGLMGQYAHGNEPSHHLAYLWDTADQPWKTQAMVRRIMKEQYRDTPDGLNGNEDCGQMSAWYVMSALGFYPLCPGRPEYLVGSPLFRKAIVDLGHGKTFTILANQNGPSHPYIQRSTLNGQPFDSAFLGHKSLAGGTWWLDMGPEPKLHLEPTAERPRETRYTGIPSLTEPADLFLDRFHVEMRGETSTTAIHYTLDGSVPDETSPRYTDPFELSQNATLRMRAYRPGAEPSLVVTRNLRRSRSLALTAVPQPGLTYQSYQGIYRSVYDFARDMPSTQGVVPTPNLEPRPRADWYALSFDGLVEIPADGTYTFFVRANDGCQLRIDGEEQFESDGRKDEAYAQQATLPMQKGFHRFELKYFQCTDKSELEVQWSGPGIPRCPLASSALFHRPGRTTAGNTP